MCTDTDIDAKKDPIRWSYTLWKTATFNLQSHIAISQQKESNLKDQYQWKNVMERDGPLL